MRAIDRITTRVMPEWMKLFSAKNEDYTNSDGTEAFKLLGLRGQFADIWGKVWKLKKSVWDGDPLSFEDEKEIFMDVIGHCFLALAILDEEREAQEEMEIALTQQDREGVLPMMTPPGQEPYRFGAQATDDPPPEGMTWVRTPGCARSHNPGDLTWRNRTDHADGTGEIHRIHEHLVNANFLPEKPMGRWEDAPDCLLVHRSDDRGWRRDNGPRHLHWIER